ncbi:uncharacterized protein TNCV_2758771 [Trichonephila clavipes]|nr:uncharacterized protein TNCV_2758771 [Trichonephila clavipes]
MIRISAQTHIKRATSKRYLKLGDFDDFMFGNCVFSCGFTKKRSVMSRRKQRSAFDHVSEFERGRIVTYRDIADYLSGKSVVMLDEIKQL